MSYCPQCFEIDCKTCQPVSRAKPAPRAKAGSHKRPVVAASQAKAVAAASSLATPDFARLVLAVAVILRAIRSFGFEPSRSSRPTALTASGLFNEALTGGLSFSEEDMVEAAVCQRAIDVSPYGISDIKAREWQVKVSQAIFDFVGGGKRDWAVLSAAVWGWEKERLKQVAKAAELRVLAQVAASLDEDSAEVDMAHEEWLQGESAAGHRVTIEATVVSSLSFSGRFGQSYVMKARFGGIPVTWFSTRETKAGTVVSITGAP
jgi:hypothetical protein